MWIFNPITGEIERMDIEGDGVSKITVSAVEPVDPEVGDLWVDIS